MLIFFRLLDFFFFAFSHAREIRRQNELLNQNLESVQRMQVESKEEVEGVASELTEWRAKKELFQVRPPPGNHPTD
jgi:hypothetical protein